MRSFGLGTDLAAAVEGLRSGTTSKQLLPPVLCSKELPDLLFFCFEILGSIDSDWRSYRSRKYYFVQISTGESTWEVPTAAAPQVPTPGGTPAQMSDPFSRPGQGGDHGNNGYGDNQGNNYGNNGPDGAQEGERGFKVS